METHLSIRSLAASVGALVEGKRIAYGNSFERAGEVLKVLYPNGISSDQLEDALAITRVVDKLFRIASRVPGKPDPYGESPWEDITGYGLLGLYRDKAKQSRFRAVIGAASEPVISSEEER